MNKLHVVMHVNTEKFDSLQTQPINRSRLQNLATCALRYLWFTSSEWLWKWWPVLYWRTPPSRPPPPRKIYNIVDLPLNSFLSRTVDLAPLYEFKSRSRKIWLDYIHVYQEWRPPLRLPRPVGSLTVLDNPNNLVACEAIWFMDRLYI